MRTDSNRPLRDRLQGCDEGSHPSWANCEEAKDAIAIIETGEHPEPDASERRGGKILKPDYAWPW